MTEINLDLSSIPFNLDHTLGCGQVFRWEKRGDSWYGVIGRRAIKLRQTGEVLTVQAYPEEREISYITNYFRLNDDLQRILASVSIDNTIKKAIQRFYGLRIVRQDPWECLISYLCATNTNIPAIRGMISNLCERFGERIEFEGREYFTFPTPSILAQRKIGELESCNLGYRASFLVDSARKISEGYPLEELSKYNYINARQLLLASSWGRKILPGVGPKVADCLLLFSLDKLESFPVDIWIQRTVLKYYPHLFEEKIIRKIKHKLAYGESPTASECERIAEKMREYFGEFAGYAQEYLYANARIDGAAYIGMQL